jgi:hypothetical protein
MRILSLTLVVLLACADPPPPPTQVTQATQGAQPKAALSAPRHVETPSKCGRPSDDAATAVVDAGDAGDAGDVGPIRDADKTIARLRPRFRKCYQDGLNIDPTMQGCVAVTARVSPDGDVERSEPKIVEGLSSDVAACITTTIKNAKFSAPGGNGATLNIPIHFIQQRQ